MKLEPRTGEGGYGLFIFLLLRNKTAHILVLFLPLNNEKNLQSLFTRHVVCLQYNFVLDLSKYVTISFLFSFTSLLCTIKGTVDIITKGTIVNHTSQPINGGLLEIT